MAARVRKKSGGRGGAPNLTCAALRRDGIGEFRIDLRAEAMREWKSGVTRTEVAGDWRSVSSGGTK
jgi:hypothetical protein